MIKLPREVIVTAALGMSRHYEECPRRDSGCTVCEDVFSTVRYALGMAVHHHADAFVTAIERYRSSL